jgi:hypothetical protein
VLYILRAATAASSNRLREMLKVSQAANSDVVLKHEHNTIQQTIQVTA